MGISIVGFIKLEKILYRFTTTAIDTDGAELVQLVRQVLV